MFFKFLEISNPPTPHFFSVWLWPYCDHDESCKINLKKIRAFYPPEKQNQIQFYEKLPPYISYLCKFGFDCCISFKRKILPNPGFQPQNYDLETNVDSFFPFLYQLITYAYI